MLVFEGLFSPISSSVNRYKQGTSQYLRPKKVVKRREICFSRRIFWDATFSKLNKCKQHKLVTTAYHEGFIVAEGVICRLQVAGRQSQVAGFRLQVLKSLKVLTGLHDSCSSQIGWS